MKKPLLLTLFFVCAPVLLAVRVLQQFYMLDSLTGFYLDGMSQVGTVVTVACLAMIPLLVFVVWLSKPVEVKPVRRSIGVGIAAAFASLCLVMSGVVGVVSADGTADTVIAMLSFLTALTFAWHSVCSFTDREYHGAFSLVGIVYGVVRLVITFMKYTGEVTITDTIFNVATMCVLLLFLYSNGKIHSGVSGKHTSTLFYAYGLATAFFCADSFLAHVVILLTDMELKMHGGGHFDMSYLGFAVYAVVVIFIYSKLPSERVKRVEAEPESDEDE